MPGEKIISTVFLSVACVLSLLDCTEEAGVPLQESYKL